MSRKLQAQRQVPIPQDVGHVPSIRRTGLTRSRSAWTRVPPARTILATASLEGAGLVRGAFLWLEEPLSARAFFHQFTHRLECEVERNIETIDGRRCPRGAGLQ